MGRAEKLPPEPDGAKEMTAGVPAAAGGRKKFMASRRATAMTAAMKTTAAPALAPFFALLALASPAAAAEIVSENFDSQALAKIEQNNGTGMTVAYVDYSSMTVGGTAHSIPEAPRPIGLALATHGVLLKADYAALANERIANLVVLDAVAGTRLNLTDNYRLKFDFYLRLSPSVTLNATGIPLHRLFLVARRISGWRPTSQSGPAR